ncbi:DUF7657 domain-containing protein [Comamonas flocculans]|uniref:YfhO family protein n=1 Tax=Comamonas flocculans TaxID=2597701 RepID=A0A5B8RUP6_9BURK|nr:hypothetical protein [Comamonas flocculans]QEA13241.1 hypothetical protein FOZ74_09485 [Comamonas flocculans]
MTRAANLDAWVQGHAAQVGTLIWVVFALLVAAGVTGSSWPLLAQGPEAALVQWRGSPAALGTPRFIRADEWGILVTNALAQVNHVPRFPVVNTLLGPEGQNMGVIGMTGTPVTQWAALARPATWAYFFLPLRQAMAWQWHLPLFACLFFLWQALRLLLPARAGLALVLAASFCAAPYAAGWSQWPLYPVAFGAALWLTLARLTQARHWRAGAAWGAAMGALLAGWALVLYPPWQISTGWCLALLALGWLADGRHARPGWHAPQWLGLLAALTVAGTLLGSWWLDTADAVARMAATVYPGGRDAQTGADIAGAPWWLLRGYLNGALLHGGLAPDAAALVPAMYANESEMSAFILLPLPLLLLAAWQATRAHPLRWTLRACLAFVAFWLVFRFVGIAPWLARATLWSRVTGVRLDLSLGLACTALLALLAAGWAARTAASASAGRVQAGVAMAVALASAGLVALEFAWLPAGVLQTDGAGTRLAMALGVGASAWWLMRGRVGAAAALLLALGLSAGLAFNPWSRAPRSMALAPEVAALAADANGQVPRTLVLSADAKAAVTLAAAGVPVVNGVLYYPQPVLWQGMGLTPQDWPAVNRYQHLSFVATPLPANGPPWRVAGELDRVRVSVDALRFDFASTGAGRVLARGEDARRLRESPRLHELGEVDGWVWFAPCTGPCIPSPPAADQKMRLKVSGQFAPWKAF